MTTYKDAGVDIEAGERAVRDIEKLVEGTYCYARGEMLKGVGGFAAAIERPNGEVFGFATDGVGTKLMVAILLGKHGTVGIDLEAMCFNDLVAVGLEPWVFLDYMAMGKQVPERTVEIVRGMTKGCHRARAALIGGEMAEMPGMYGAEDYDLAGFAVGYAPSRDALITGERIEPGMHVYGLPSSGVHANGFSLVRKVFGVSPDDREEAREALSVHYRELGQTLGEELLRPALIYAEDVARIRRDYDITGLVHITGGGLVGNPPRVMPEGCAVRLDLGTWEVLPIFRLIAKRGRVSLTEMLRTFNVGLGMLVITPDRIDDDILEPVLVGEVVESRTTKTQFVGGHDIF